MPINEEPETYVKDKYLHEGEYGNTLQVTKRVRWKYDIAIVYDQESSLLRITNDNVFVWVKKRQTEGLISFEDGKIKRIKPRPVTEGIQNHMHILKPHIQKQVLKLCL